MAVNQKNIVNVDAATTNITTSAYVELSASTPIPFVRFLIVNTTSSIIKLAYGASGSETDLIAVHGSDEEFITLGASMPAGTRLALEALDTSATTGYVAVSMLP